MNYIIIYIIYLSGAEEGTKKKMGKLEVHEDMTLRWPDGSKYTGNFEANNLPGPQTELPFKKRIRITMI